MTGLPEIIILPAQRLPPEGEPGPPGLDLRLLARELSRCGYRTRVANLHRLPLNPLAGAHPLWRAIDPLRTLVLALSRRPTVALCCYESAALGLVLLRPLLRSPLRVVVLETGIPGSWRLRDRILRLVVRRADAVLQVCSALADAVQTWEPRSAPNHVLLDAVDPEFFQPGGDRPDGPVVAVGDDPGRDFETFAEAVTAAGVPAVAKTRRIAEDRARWPSLCVLPARLANLEYRALLESASIVVVPLRRATNASGVTTLLEAMALGKPVIASESPGLRDYLRSDETCLAVPCGDAAAMAAAIRRLREDACLRGHLGTGAREHVTRYCSPAAQAAALDGILRRLPAPGG